VKIVKKPLEALDVARASWRAASTSGSTFFAISTRSGRSHDWPAQTSTGRSTLQAGRPAPHRAAPLLLTLAAVLMACTAPEPAPPAAIEQTSSDGALQLTLRVAQDRISIADNLTIRVETAFPESFEVDFPEKLGAESLFRSASSDSGAPKLGEDGRVHIEQTYEIEPYVPGPLSIPPIEVRYRDKAAPESEKTLTTEAFQVEVEPVPSAEQEATELRDIHDPLAMPFPLAWIVGAALAVVAAAAGAWWWWKSKQQPAPVVEEPPEPADIAALRQLDELVAEGLAQQGRIKELYGGVSDILRRYIEARFGLHAPEQTTESGKAFRVIRLRRKS